MTTETKKEEQWIKSHWRPMMGAAYIIICLFDFVFAPITNYIYFYATGGEFAQWKSLTMSESGLFHISMGAILGISAWTRGQEKIKRTENNEPTE